MGKNQRCSLLLVLLDRRAAMTLERVGPNWEWGLALVSAFRKFICDVEGGAHCVGLDKPSEGNVENLNDIAFSIDFALYLLSKILKIADS